MELSCEIERIFICLVREIIRLILRRISVRPIYENVIICKNANCEILFVERTEGNSCKRLYIFALRVTYRPLHLPTSKPYLNSLHLLSFVWDLLSDRIACKHLSELIFYTSAVWHSLLFFRLLFVRYTRV